MDVRNVSRNHVHCNLVEEIDFILANIFTWVGIFQSDQKAYMLISIATVETFKRSKMTKTFKALKSFKIIKNFEILKTRNLSKQK